MTSVEEHSVGERFSRALRASTWDDHEKAEYTEYMQALLDGKLSRDGYAALVAQHYFPYLVIEQAAEQMRSDPVAGPFVSDGLTRTPALERDLAFLYGPDWRRQIAPSPATEAYLARLREVCFRWPGGFVAHHYTRYLGDLSGGQVIRHAAEKTYGLVDHVGAEFYVFDRIGSARQFKIDYRSLLDRAPWDEAERQRVIAEVTLAYRLNTAVLAELGRDSARFRTDH